MSVGAAPVAALPAALRDAVSPTLELVLLLRLRVLRRDGHEQHCQRSQGQGCEEDTHGGGGEGGRCKGEGLKCEASCAA